MKEEKLEEIWEKKVVKHGNKWCVVHCSEAKKDQIIKCFFTKKEADRMHRAIQRSQALRKKELPYDTTILSNEELYNDTITFIKIYHDILYDIPSSYSLDEIMDCAACTLSEISNRKNEDFCDYQFNPQSYPENSISRGFWNEVKQYLSNGEIAQLMMNEEAYTQLKKEAYNRKGLVLEKSTELCDEDYKILIKTGEFENKPLPKKYYRSPSLGTYIAQIHVIGITQQEHDDYEAGKIPLWKSFVGHSIHVDWRGKFEGRKELLQIVIVESSIDAYLRVLQGEKDKKTNNVAKGLMVVKNEKIDSSTYEKDKKDMILNPTNAKKIAKFVIEDKSFFIEPDKPGATKDTYGYLGCIGYGDVKTGTMRCMTRGTKIITLNKRGLIRRQNIGNIVDRKENVKILTPSGFQKIVDYIEIDATDVLSIVLENGTRLNCDIDHPSLVYRASTIQKIYAKDLIAGDLIPIYRNGYEGQNGTYDLGKYIGLYLAEGNGHAEKNRNMDLVFCFNKHETDLIKFVTDFSHNLGANVHHRNDKRNDGFYVNVSQGQALVGLMNQFMRDDKSLYSRVFGLSSECRRGIIDGLYLGDGNVNGSKGQYKQILQGPRHRKLMNDILNLCFSVGDVASIRQYTKNEEIYGQRAAVSFNLNNFKWGPWIQHRINGETFIKIEKIEKNPQWLINSGLKKLYDVALEKDHRIVLANGIITSNSDYKELFCTPSKDLPTKNESIFNGRWIWKAFKKPRYLWWCWEAATNPNAGNSWIGCDQGNYQLKPAEDVTRFGKEEYSEYASKKKNCKDQKNQ